MDRTVRTYDPNNVVATLGGINLNSGTAEGTFINVEPRGDAFDTVKGSDGSLDRVNKQEHGVIITITLKSTSIVNGLLSVLHNADKVSNAGILPFLMKDLLTLTDAVAAEQAWVARPPNNEKADSISNREWIIHTGPALVNFDGNL